MHLVTYLHPRLPTDSAEEPNASVYEGAKYDQTLAVVLPKNNDYLLPIWAFCSSTEYNEAVRRIDQKLNVTNATLVKVPFDLNRWT